VTNPRLLQSKKKTKINMMKKRKTTMRISKTHQLMMLKTTKTMKKMMMTMRIKKMQQSAMILITQG